MRRRKDIRSFLAEHGDTRILEQVPTIFGAAVTPAETEFRRQLLVAGHSSSYIALLGLAAALTFDAGEYFHASQEARRDQNEWHGYHRGLQTSLACLVMHETGCDPGKAALLVAEHTEALIRCRWTSQPSKGGE